MRKPLLFLFLILTCNAYSQSTAENEVRNTIKYFFEGFHKGDVEHMQSVLSDELHMQRIGKDPKGIPYIKNESVDEFLTAISSIPDTLKIEERLHSFTIQTDGDMAHAWTPYSFYVQGKLHHCGVNSFQLFNDGNSWKIIYIVDTRQVAGCREREAAD